MPDISFTERGVGHTIIFIHGFPMNSEVWAHFAEGFQNDYKIITLDLPGFGNSPSLETPFSIDEVATHVNQWLSDKGINNSIIVGHSLGGYVALAMVEKNPEKFAGLGLFHSTAFADNDEKKLSRTKTIEFVKKNGAIAFTSNFIPTLFADKKDAAIEKVKRISVQSTEQAVIGYTLAMRERPDRTEILKAFTKPVLFIGGEKDVSITPESVSKQALLTRHPETHILERVAHMGMFEDIDKTTNLIRTFANKCFNVEQPG